jgi:hypothetical protein
LRVYPEFPSVSFVKGAKRRGFKLATPKAGEAESPSALREKLNIDSKIFEKKINVTIIFLT